MQTLLKLHHTIAAFNEAIFNKDFHFYWDATYPGYMHTQELSKKTKAKDLLIICHYDGSQLHSIGDYHLAFKNCTKHDMPANKSCNDNYENHAIEIVETITNIYSEDKQQCFVEKCTLKLWVAQGYAFDEQDYFTIECKGFYFKKLE